MKWDYREEIIVVMFYKWCNCDLSICRDKIDILIDILYSNGFDKHDKESILMRLANINYIHTGNGLSNAAKQTKEIYNIVFSLNNVIDAIFNSNKKL